jgi:hypothetical protein
MMNRIDPSTPLLIYDDPITYTPNLDFVGNDSFVYEICDTGLLQSLFDFIPVRYYSLNILKVKKK